MQYVKIKDSIVEQIEAGMLAPRQKLPAERKLAESFDTTRVTLREALSLLEAEGRIYREDRRGWFISPVPLRYDPTQTLNFTNMALAQNRVPKTQLLGAKAILANKVAARLLNLQPFSDVFRVDRVRYLEDRPVVYVTNYVRPELFPNLLDHDLSNSLTDIYREHFGVSYQKRATAFPPVPCSERWHRHYVQLLGRLQWWWSALTTISMANSLTAILNTGVTTPFVSSLSQNWQDDHVVK